MASFTILSASFEKAAQERDWPAGEYRLSRLDDSGVSGSFYLYTLTVRSDPVYEAAPTERVEAASPVSEEKAEREVERLREYIDGLPYPDEICAERDRLAEALRALMDAVGDVRLAGPAARTYVVHEAWRAAQAALGQERQ